jgi:hypothetical protein
MREWTFVPRESERCRRGISRAALGDTSGQQRVGEGGECSRQLFVNGEFARQTGRNGDFGGGRATGKRTSGCWKQKMTYAEGQRRGRTNAERCAKFDTSVQWRRIGSGRLFVNLHESRDKYEKKFSIEFLVAIFGDR